MGGYCIIAQVFFGSYLRTMRVPESRIPLATQNGWTVVIRDSDMPFRNSWHEMPRNVRRSWGDDEALHDQRLLDDE